MAFQKNVSGNIRKYYLFEFFHDLAFFAPVIVLFWQSRGLNMTQIMSLQSIYAVGVVVLEIPTGVLADYFGKKLALVLGSLFFTIGLFWYGISFKFWQFALGEIICGVGAAFISGADRAFIHQTLKSLKREGDYKKIEGRARGLTKISLALGNFFGGLIGSISLGLTLVASAVAAFAGFLVGVSFAETKISLPRKEKTDYGQIVKDSLKIIKNNSGVLWLVLFFASFNGILWTVNWYSQPYLKMINVPVVYFGFIFAGFSIIAAVASSLVDRFEKLTKGRAFLVMSLLTPLAMFLIGRFPSLYLFPLWSLFGAFAIMNETLVSDKVLAQIPSERAATILSFQNLARRFLYAALGPFLGMVGDSFGIKAALQMNAVILGVVLMSLILLKRKLKLSFV